MTSGVRATSPATEAVAIAIPAACQPCVPTSVPAVGVRRTLVVPAPISETEAAAILRRVQVGTEQATPKTVFEPGELVRVVDGPFNDFNGVVEEVNYEKNRLQVAVTIFGRSTPVELDFGQVEKG